MPSSTHTKHISQMTTDELKAAAHRQALEFYTANARNNPHSEPAQEAYRNYCLLNGIDPSTGRPSRFNNMSLAQIGQEWETEGRKVEAQELDGWREKNAETWLASQPAYEANLANAAKLTAEIERLGLRGSVNDLQVCFDRLVHSGDIVPKPLPPVPVELPSMEDFSQMTAAEMKAYIEDAERKGIL